MNKVSIIYRFSSPSKLDTADFGTLCKVSKNFNYIDFYIQLSSNSEDPHWEKLDSASQEEALKKAFQLVNKKN